MLLFRKSDFISIHFIKSPLFKPFSFTILRFELHVSCFEIVVSHTLSVGSLIILLICDLFLIGIFLILILKLLDQLCVKNFGGSGYCLLLEFSLSHHGWWPKFFWLQRFHRMNINIFYFRAHVKIHQSHSSRIRLRSLNASLRSSCWTHVFGSLFFYAICLLFLGET